MSDGVSVREMRQADLDRADRVFRLAFGTFFQAPDPANFRGDAALVEPRWRSYPDGGVVAERDGAIIGMSFASRWGSLGVLGPVAVFPDYWKHGIARQMLGPTVAIIERWRCRLGGLFTFPQSASHLRLYQEFGFWPRFLTPVMMKTIAATAESAPGTISLTASSDRAALIAGCAALTDEVYAGLDLGREISGVVEHGLGDVLILTEGSGVAGFAICHSGLGSEAGSTGCYVKFALVRSGGDAAARLTRLIAGCEAFARARGIAQISAGVSSGRIGAYRLLVALGFRTQLNGIAMHRPWQEAYDRPEVFALDDWR
jgi:GNAT superfamily N-acetyltransferase